MATSLSLHLYFVFAQPHTHTTHLSHLNTGDKIELDDERQQVFN